MKKVRTCKSLKVLMIIGLLLSFVIRGQSVYADDTTATITIKDTTYDTLEAAVENSEDNDIIQIGEGTVKLDKMIEITKNITIQGKERKTIIHAPFTGDGHSAFVIHYVDGTHVNFYDITLDGGKFNSGLITWNLSSANGYKDNANPIEMPTLDIERCYFTNTNTDNKYVGGSGIGLWNIGAEKNLAASNVTIKDCEFTQLSLGIYFSEENALPNLKANIENNVFDKLSWGGIAGIPANAHIHHNTFTSNSNQAIQFLLNKDLEKTSTVIENNIMNSTKGIQFMPYHLNEGNNTTGQGTIKITSQRLPVIKNNVRETDTNLVLITAYRSGTDEISFYEDNALDLSSNYTCGERATIKIEIQDASSGKVAPLVENVAPQFKNDIYYINKEKTTLNTDAKEITLNKDNIQLELGQNETLIANAKDYDGNSVKVTLKADSSDIISLDQQGKIIALKAGTTNVVASAGGKNVSCKVVVNEPKIDIPTVDTTKPVEKAKVTVTDTTSQEVAKDTLSSLLSDIAKNNSSTAISEETAEKVKKALNEGEAISLKVNTSIIDESELDKETVQEISKVLLSKTEDTKSNIQIVEYLDIRISLMSGENVLGDINQLNDKMKFTIVLPKELQDTDKQFYIVKVHNGKTELLETTRNDDGTITFETDQFSTYALAYAQKNESHEGIVPPPTITTPAETPKPTEVPTSTETKQSPTKTGDESQVGIYIATLGIAVSGGIILIAYKKRKELLKR